MWHHRAILSVHLSWKWIILFFSILVSSSNYNTVFFQVMEIYRRLKACRTGVMYCPMFPWGRLWCIRVPVCCKWPHVDKSFSAWNYMTGCSSSDYYLVIVLHRILYYVISDYIILSITSEQRILIPSLQIPKLLKSFKRACVRTFIFFIKNTYIADFLKIILGFWE